MKKFSIVFSSATGNTEMLAARLSELLPEDELAYFGPPDGLPEPVPDSEIVFAGFWIMRGEPDPASKEFLQKLGGKTVFLFGTAGFSLSSAYFDDTLARVRGTLPSSAAYGGGFMCAGKMPLETCLKYRAALMSRPNDQKIMRMIDNFDRASTHPDESDLDDFEASVRVFLKKGEEK